MFTFPSGTACIASVLRYKLISWVAAVLCMASMSRALPAAEPTGSTINLREVLAATLEANPQLGVYRFREAAVSGEALTAGLKPPLQVNAGIEDALGSGTLSALDQAEFSLSLSQVIELGEQRAARVGVTSRRLELIEAEQRVTELDLLAEATRRFIAVAVAQEQLVLRERATALAQQTLDALEPLVTAGQSPASEQSRATAALERARLAEASARTNVDAAKVDLTFMWAGDSPEFDRVGADLLETGDAGNLPNLLLGIEDNPDVLLFASEERLRDAELREAVSAQRGSFQWTAGVRHLREVGDTGLVLGFSMPLGSRERARGAIASAEAGVSEVASRREVGLNRLRNQLNTLHLQLTQALLEVNTLRDNVLPQLDTAQEQTRSAYLNGLYSYLELISAQSEYLDAQQALINAAADVHLLRTEIERLSGATLNPATQETNP
jgi:cobalt-zinc-cadmium efflux system outer membrane protein